MMVRRDFCPTCQSGESLTVLAYPYSDSGLFGYMCAYYEHADPEAIRRRLRDCTYTLLECSKCGLIYQREIPDSDFLREIYSNWIIAEDPLAPTSPPMPIGDYAYLSGEVMHLLAAQRAVVGSERRIHVLDFGMGWGAWLQMARSLGATVHGAELSGPKIAFARSIGIPVLDSEQIGQMRFDLICTEQVFEHLAHPAQVLKSLVAALAPTGYMKISVPSGDSIKQVLSTWQWQNAIERQSKLMPVHPLEHINCFTRKSLDAFAAQFGLERAPIDPLRAIAFAADWSSLRSVARNVLRPIYRFGLKRGTYAIYRRRPSEGSRLPSSS